MHELKSEIIIIAVLLAVLQLDILYKLDTMQ